MKEFIAACEQVDPITLEELTATAALMEREEKKYFVPAPLLARLIDKADGLRVLQIDGERFHQYTSVYYDTPSLLFFRHHVQGRRIRHKVRIRKYASGPSFLEVKGKGRRGVTIKERIDLGGETRINEDHHEFIEEHLGRTGVTNKLRRTLVVSYTRLTFALGFDRVTCDLNLEFHPTQNASGRGQPVTHHDQRHLLVETKTESGRGQFDKLLNSVGIRPASISKYGVGISLSGRQVPTNRWNQALRRQFSHDPKTRVTLA